MDEAKETLYTFSQALEYVKVGHRMARKGWNGKNMYIRIDAGDKQADKAPFIMFRPAVGKLVPWVASHTDMLSDDWINLSQM